MSHLQSELKKRLGGKISSKSLSMSRALDKKKAKKGIEARREVGRKQSEGDLSGIRLFK